jgi:outer membrane autotransporter protein
MLQYAQSDADAKRTNSTLESDDWGFAGYGTWFQDNGLFLEAIAGYISHDYDSQRRINYTTNVGGVTTVVNQIASASPSGDTLFGGIGGGYSIARDAFTFTPQASLNYSRQSIDGYREAMSNPTGPGGSWAVAVDGQDFTSMTSRLGFMLANAISTGVGVFVPQLSVDWVHEFDDGLERVNSRFVNDRSGQRFQVYSDHSDKNWFDVGLGLSAQFAQGRSAFVSVNWLAGRADEDTYSITGGIRLEF